ncbi:hypothetical protein [Nocardioides sp. Kera G14]|uniref:hypothetical protein n=1 Tax=Nocardioides sp. Kera G14 TaxID=2884264 RepID=UPI001D129290|nr:hypothetical protein [Nocardioides sp. Kera G14]UDY23759.1 hypothetical protein LH076_00225 [Nocardioides sp. Kera G14]
MALATDPSLRSSDVSHVLVLAPAELAAEARLAATAVGAVRPDLALNVDTSVRSVGALVSAVQAVPDIASSAAEVRETVRRRLLASISGAWLPSVTKLANPNPGMGLHIRSLVARGAGFIALRDDPAWVAQLPLKQQASHRISHLAEGDAVCFGELPEPAISALFGFGLTQRPTRVDSLPDVAGEWGSAEAVEFVLRAPVVSRPRLGTCAVCGDPVWERTCPFCHAGLRGAAPTTSSGALQ